MADGDLELRVAWQRHVGRDPDADATFASVVRRHHGAGRHYHDVRHVRWVVRHVLALAEQHPVADLDAVVAAAFFHDAVYAPERDDNEARSAELAVTSLHALGWATPRCERVAAMILATEHRGQLDPPDTGTFDTGTFDTDVLLAADLAILGAEPAAYADAVRNIRREYAHLDDAAWCAGRSALIDGFLGRASIYPERLEMTTWERRARANLTAELAALR